ncbi:MAG TPA: ClbS/DfsB family four-helix bundle protein [Candidatus Methylomirabilis sp.]|nr:ClbS/DfsB family four-helix bundle protein [Candidatus Methylomirabilis sp.]HSD52371.1 ClbS/DfsB family four-helix bundle protein [Candidatus Methylomirabilis sp.]
MTGQPGRREQLLAELDEAFAGLQATHRDLPETRKRVVMQGTWSVKDILVHIAGWHREMAGALTRIATGERAVPEGVDYSNFDAWNARFVEAARATPVAEVEKELTESFAAFRQAVGALPEKRLIPGRTADRIVHEAGTDHYRHHAAQIQSWRQRERL